MSLAENLLNSLDEAAYQNTRIAGSVQEEHIKVGQDRVITVPNSLKTIAVKGDKDIETATIDCVRYWDGHDLSTFAIYLNYILPNGDEGTYIPKSISKTEDAFSFDWLIGSELTYAQGKLTFWIVTKLTDDNGELVKQWSSFQNSDCSIAQGGGKIYVPEKQTDQDVISQAISISRESAETAKQQAKLAKDAAEKAATDAREAAEDEVSRIIGELGVVQELGDSPNSVVSQLKVTNEFNQTNAKINRNSKRIANLEQGIPEELFVTDNSVAYQKDVPANVLTYAEVQKVGGMTYKDGDALRSAKVTEVRSVGVNLIAYPFNEQTKTSNGVTWIADNGGITGSGVPTSVSWLTLGYIYIRDLSSKILRIRLFGDYQNMRLSLELLRMDGSSITTLYVYKADSFNLDNYIDVYRIRVRVYRESDNTTVSGTIYPIISTVATSEYIPYRSYSLPIPSAVQALDGYGMGINAENYNYITWKPDDNIKTYTKVVEQIVLDGTEKWALVKGSGSGLSYFYISIGDYGYVSNYAVICNRYEQVSITTSNTLVGCSVLNSSASNAARLTIRPENVESYTVDTWKAYLAEQYANGTPITVVYALGSQYKVTEDISDLITSDNLIGVEGGGTLTFENEYGYAAPSEVEYQVEV